MGLDDMKDKIADAGQDFKHKSEDAEQVFDEAGTKLGETSKDIKNKSEDALDHDRD